MKTLVFPTKSKVWINIPEDYPIPPIGSEFNINYENFTPAESWFEVRSLLDRNVLTLEKIEDDEIFLHEGPLQMFAMEDEEVWKELFSSYWELHPETNPATKPFPRQFVAHTGMMLDFHYPIDAKEMEFLQSLRVVGIFDTFDEWLKFKMEYDSRNKEVEIGVSEYPSVPTEFYDLNHQFSLKLLMEEFLASDEPEPYCVTLNYLEIISVERTERRPYQDYPQYKDLEIETSLQPDGTTIVWCLARSKKDACRFAFYECYLDTVDDIEE